jgi:hypothetical protein
MAPRESHPEPTPVSIRRTLPHVTSDAVSFDVGCLRA